MTKQTFAHLLVFALCVGMLALAWPSDARAADLDRSRLHNLKALKLLKARNYEEAVKEFQRAFYAAPSASPLINIAKVYEGQKRRDLAMDYYRMAIEHVETDKEREDLAVLISQIKADLLQQMTLIQVRTPGVEADVTLKMPDTGAIVYQCISPCDIWVDGGSYIAVATKRGYQYAERPIAIEGKGVFLATIELYPTSDRALVNVTANVASAVVLVNRVKVGETPFREALPPGPTLVRIEKPGFSAWETEIALAPGEIQHLHVFLKTEDEVLLEGAKGAVVLGDVPPGGATPPPAPQPCPEPTGGGAQGEPKVIVQEKIVEKIVTVEVPGEGGGGGPVPKWLKWVFLGVGTGAAGGGVGLHMVGNGRMSDANSLAKDTPNYAGRFFDMRDEGQFFTSQAYMLYGLGGACLITGSLLWILEAVNQSAMPLRTMDEEVSR